MKIGFSTIVDGKEFYAETKPNKILTVMTILTYYSAFGIINNFQGSIHFDNDILYEYFNKNKHKIRFKMLAKACSGTKRQKIIKLAREKNEDSVEFGREVLLNIVIDNLLKSQNPEYIVNHEIFEEIDYDN